MKYADFTLVTRRTTLAQPTDDDHAIFQAARAQLERVDAERPVRLTGVSVSGFAAGVERAQLALFDADPAPERAQVEKRRSLNAAIDALARRFGEGAVTRADSAEEPDGEGEER